jgi:exopolyphosphatase/guanosine-5'-triphosphate,3'-diphosphate pyrophosphatase
VSSAEPVAIIDIGSNSVRLVVYAGAPRVPAPIFNEKVLAGLGAGLEQRGTFAPAARDKALAALRRFRLLIDHMKVKRTYVLATAAIREADDGREFVREVDRIGFRCEVLSPEREAELAGEGVLSAIPQADGIVGDLGGGSLELVDVADREIHGGLSLPLGVLRLDASQSGERETRRAVRDGVRRLGGVKQTRGRTFFMVGGSWRALARIDMAVTDYPLPITHEYRLAPKRIRELRRIVGEADAKWLKAAAAARLASAPVAAMLLDVLADELEPSDLVVSTFGIREGLLYSALKPRTRARDPLIEAAREAGGGEHRFGQHGDLLDEWISPLFDDTPEMARLRRASCLLADVAWQANPNFRADRGVEMALHGNWVAITAAGRVIMAQALSSNFGREKLPGSRLAQLCSDDELRRAHHWGLAMRLGQRLSGGVASVLEHTGLSAEDGTIRLHALRAEQALVGEPVKRRLARLGEALGCDTEIVVAV